MTGWDSANMQPGENPHPIQRLCHPDIFTEIFTFCLPEVPKAPGRFNAMSSRKVPLLLCSVCSSWRSLAISTPRLWQELYLYVNFSDETINKESVTHGIRTWLDRSKPLPLSIRINSWRATTSSPILEMLLQEILRWESFELFGEMIWVRSTSPHFSFGPELQTSDISESIDTIPFTAALHLKKLCLNSLPNITSVSTTPWDQLVELNVWQTQEISTVAEVIRRCPRLESLSLQVKEGVEGDSLTITQHDTLRKLHLYYLGTQAHINAVTDRLTLPALTDLALWSTLSLSKDEAKFCCSRLIDFFTRSHCGLQEFELRFYGSSGFGPGELLKCFSHRSCQTLTRLVIQQRDAYSHPMVERELLTRLTYSDANGDVPLCPKLGHLKWIDCYHSDSLFPDLLGRMIQSRCFGRARDTQLKSLHFQSRYSLSREDCELLKFAQNNGGLKLVKGIM